MHDLIVAYITISLASYLSSLVNYELPLVKMENKRENKIRHSLPDELI